MSVQRSNIGNWFRSGTPWIWLNAAAVSASLIMVVGLLGLIAVRGLVHFWPNALVEFDYVQPNGETLHVIGEIQDSEIVPRARIEASGVDVPGTAVEVKRLLIKTGNRDHLGLDFRWLVEPLVQDRRMPRELIAVERYEWGNFYGYLQAVKENGQVVAQGDAAWQALQARLARAGELQHRIEAIEKGRIGDVNYAMEQLRLKQRRLELEGRDTPENLAAIEAERARLDADYKVLQQQLGDLYRQLRRDSFTATIMDGREVEVPLAKVVRAYRPNAMHLGDKIGFYFAKLWEFVSDEPREANTEGGIFPAIFGTVTMVILMSVFVTPFGVIAAVYLREYAKQGPLTRTIRIAVNNLAGVPSIVYGVFGLGFFVYFLGGSIDDLFFPEAQPAPTFGTPGLFWASLTLALLTLPVVIVATEEGLSRIPKSIREGSLALGATKAETLWRTVLPMASPAMMTGLILAVARAAGEVAPLMLVGVVKLAPSLPVDGNPPFVHLERKFMHLGFHIYDVGFQSPNVEAARPLVYATALLLVLVIVVLNLAAIAIRNRLREQFKSFDQG
ncbi:phosphate transport system permease protein PstA [Thiohalobacter sp. COW1]|uniref:Phosphate transport system permease protein PstA n=1 Tax=Thiohalobacter thiocyanaticus TaxID=585455 RepID=A0A1Z4VTG4_9GAMM|nr:phosphate ABC transporter inner membrane subunit PstA [Thiohalobacter thiocyanaticus]BCO33160.1 phosphate transport system permease protein PstA [Thiohalobacter sp. COW1]